MSRTSCPGGITTSRARRPARTRCRSACQRPPSTCSRRSRRRCRTRRPGLPTRGLPTRGLPTPGRARPRRVTGPTSRRRRIRRPARRRSRAPARRPSRPAARPILTSPRPSPAGRCTTRRAHPAGGRRAPAAPGGPAGPAGPAASAGQPGPATPMTPVASPRPGRASGPPWKVSRETGPLPAVPGSAGPGGPNGPAGSSPSEAGANGDYKGLPRRVRQASLAPQLRDDPPPRRTTLASSGASGGVPGYPGSPGSPGSPGPSPAEIRQTMSALQRGWQEGRSQRIAEQATGESPGAGPGSPARRRAGHGSRRCPQFIRE